MDVIGGGCAQEERKLRTCFDSKDLNVAVQREHQSLPSIEDIATRLHGAKIFTILDVRSEFLLITFNTPFGRFRWKIMPFGINCAP